MALAVAASSTKRRPLKAASDPAQPRPGGAIVAPKRAPGRPRILPFSEAAAAVAAENKQRLDHYKAQLDKIGYDALDQLPPFFDRGDIAALMRAHGEPLDETLAYSSVVDTAKHVFIDTLCKGRVFGRYATAVDIGKHLDGMSAAEKSAITSFQDIARHLLDVRLGSKLETIRSAVKKRTDLLPLTLRSPALPTHQHAGSMSRGHASVSANLPTANAPTAMSTTPGS
ncbi:MAG: hypothetical protein JWQ11_555 [Rhizobacter sp.]|nr:hypothetical protein [Rhizobacter sp.]